MLFLFLLAISTAGFILVLRALIKSRGNKADNIYWSTKEIALGILCWITGIFAITVLITGFSVNGTEYVNQLNDIEDIQKFQEFEATYQTRADDLIAEFQKYLADTYPQHELTVYENISPDNLSIYLAKYPELRAADTLMKLVDEVRSLSDDVYQQQINIANAEKNIRVRSRNPWLLTFIFPS